MKKFTFHDWCIIGIFLRWAPCSVLCRKHPGRTRTPPPSALPSQGLPTLATHAAGNPLPHPLLRFSDQMAAWQPWLWWLQKLTSCHGWSKPPLLCGSPMQLQFPLSATGALSAAGISGPLRKLTGILGFVSLPPAKNNNPVVTFFEIPHPFTSLNLIPWYYYTFWHMILNNPLFTSDKVKWLK